MGQKNWANELLQSLSLRSSWQVPTPQLDSESFSQLLILSGKVTLSLQGLRQTPIQCNTTATTTDTTTTTTTSMSVNCSMTLLTEYQIQSIDSWSSWSGH